MTKTPPSLTDTVIRPDMGARTPLTHENLLDGRSACQDRLILRITDGGLDVGYRLCEHGVQVDERDGLTAWAIPVPFRAEALEAFLNDTMPLLRVVFDGRDSKGGGRLSEEARKAARLFKARLDKFVADAANFVVP